MRMAQFKWAAAAWLLRGGHDVVLSDPDVVLLRDPVAYVVRPRGGRGVKWGWVGMGAGLSCTSRAQGVGA